MINDKNYNVFVESMYSINDCLIFNKSFASSLPRIEPETCKARNLESHNANRPTGSGLEVDLFKRDELQSFEALKVPLTFLSRSKL